MIIMLALLILVILNLDVNLLLSIAMIIMDALMTLAILLLVAFSPILQIAIQLVTVSFATIQTNASQALATLLKEFAPTLRSSAMTIISAQLIPAMEQLDVFSRQLFAMIKIHALLILAMEQLDVFSLQWFAMIIMLAPTILVSMETAPLLIFLFQLQINATVPSAILTSVSSTCQPNVQNLVLDVTHKRDASPVLVLDYHQPFRQQLESALVLLPPL